MKKSTRFVCQECGSFFPRWMGRCTDCGSWSTLVEEQVVSDRPSKSKESVSPQNLSDINIKPLTRINTGIDELDRVLGGGIVPGSVILLGGDPGIGKSTISLQLSNYLGNQEICSLYVSGEESYEQVKLRSKRLGINSGKNIKVLCETSIVDVLYALEKSKYDFIIVDSIQTLSEESLNSPPGSVSQLRECTSRIVNFAKTKNVPAMVIGHVNKEGAIAGPKIIEHMVDTVLYFEGQTSQEYRIIRSIKNRFGSTNEIGIFEMCGDGLKEVSNPASYFLTNDTGQIVPGTIYVPALEGTRPIMHEIQALVSPCPVGIPRRTAMGIDPTKLAIVIAVLEKRFGLRLHDQDVYVKVIGGRKINDPACDLAIAAAIYSSFKNIPLDQESIALGELGLSGEIRNVNYLDARITEVDKLGIKKAVVPKQKKHPKLSASLSICEIASLSEALEALI